MSLPATATSGSGGSSHASIPRPAIRRTAFGSWLTSAKSSAPPATSSTRCRLRSVRTRTRTPGNFLRNAPTARRTAPPAAVCPHPTLTPAPTSAGGSNNWRYRRTTSCTPANTASPSAVSRQVCPSRTSHGRARCGPAFWKTLSRLLMLGWLMPSSRAVAAASPPFRTSAARVTRCSTDRDDGRGMGPAGGEFLFPNNLAVELPNGMVESRHRRTARAPAPRGVRLTARQKLEQRLAAALAPGPSALAAHMDDTAAALAAVFPHAQVVIIQNLYAGFRVRTGEQILLVEVAHSGERDGLHVVKLGPADRLHAEWEAWQSCRPHGLRHDIVLMGLRREPAEGDPIAALVYDDAQQLIGVDRTLTLEEAALNAVQLGSPAVESVADLLDGVYERLALLLYRCSGEAPRPDGDGFTAAFFDRRLAENLDAWDRQGTDAFDVRVRANEQTDPAPLNEQFRDPASLMRHILARRNPATVPLMLRGRSHGDLHGRNVLVGQVGERVLWPAVYDYGDMGRENWVARDFVKLEVELKVRAYPLVFDAVTAARVVPFEAELAEATRYARNAGTWPALSPHPTAERRLFWLLLQLRRLAGRHLTRPGRAGGWLAEYAFQLAVYGLNAGRFDNLSPVERLGAYLAAGSAAAWYAPPARRRIA